MKGHPVILLVLLAITHFLICILSGALGWEIQFLVVSVSGITATWISYRNFNGSLKKILLVILPFYLLYSSLSIYVRSYETFPIWILGFTGCMLTYLTMRSLKDAWKRVVILSLIPLFGYFIVLPNNFAFLYHETNSGKYKLHNSIVRNEAGAAVDMKSLKGKITLLDIWSTNCLPCIKKFPDLQKLQDWYSNDSLVKIVSLNIPLPRDTVLKANRFTNTYSFEKLYFKDQEEASKLSIDAVPLVLILDKNLNCRFAGDLNIGRNIFIGNAARVIERLKRE